MSRIPDITERDHLPEAQRWAFDEIVGSRGSVRGPFKALLHSPDLGSRAGKLGAYLRFESESTLPSRLRELSALVSARLLDCGYEYAAHHQLAGQAGVSEDEWAAIRTYNRDGLPEADRWLYDFVEQLLLKHRIDDATFAQARQRLNEQGVVELAANVGYYAFLATVLNTFQIEPVDV
jgi:4-carboxymuconolactone decarboxylase